MEQNAGTEANTEKFLTAILLKDNGYSGAA
jgi:hypothetical protein